MECLLLSFFLYFPFFFHFRKVILERKKKSTADSPFYALLENVLQPMSFSCVTVWQRPYSFPGWNFPRYLGWSSFSVTRDDTIDYSTSASAYILDSSLSLRLSHTNISRCCCQTISTTSSYVMTAINPALPRQRPCFPEYFRTFLKKDEWSGGGGWLGEGIW